VPLLNYFASLVNLGPFGAPLCLPDRAQDFPVRALVVLELHAGTGRYLVFSLGFGNSISGVFCSFAHEIEFQ
jgi:hypothetical protein